MLELVADGLGWGVDGDSNAGLARGDEEVWAEGSVDKPCRAVSQTNVKP